MKKIFMFGFLILFLTGCQKNSVMMCTLTNKDENHTNDYILSANFEEDILMNMSLSGTSIYKDTDSTEAAYLVIKQGYDELNSLDDSIETEVYYSHEKIYFKMRLYTNKIDDNGLKYLQNIFGTNKGYPNRNDFMAYVKANNYICD